MAASGGAFSYTLQSPPRGQALVFIIDTFDKKTAQAARVGADYDESRFTEAFEKWGLEVTIFKNLGNLRTQQELKKFAESPERATEDLVVIAFSTHGDQMPVEYKRELAADVVYTSDGILAVRLIAKYFSEENCPALAKKPKIFFFQSCRGDKYDETVQVEDGQCTIKTMDTSGIEDRMVPVDIPIYKDSLMAFASPPGYKAFRSTKNGSWFVNALHDEIMARQEPTNLMSLLTMVSKRMATTDRFMVTAPSENKFHEMNRKTVPWTLSMLTKDLYL